MNRYPLFMKKKNYYVKDEMFNEDYKDYKIDFHCKNIKEKLES